MNIKLKEARKANRYSQQGLANASGVSRTTINGIETGRIKVIKSETLVKLANALGTTVQQIFFAE